MRSLKTTEKIKYLVIGHLTKDLIPEGAVMGGTAAYSALTAQALGLRTGVVSSQAPDFSTPELDGIFKIVVPSDFTTTFENIYSPSGRTQIIHHRAALITANDIPNQVQQAKIVHLGPVANEIDADIIRAFPHSFIGVTPQGWMRSWNKKGEVSYQRWENAENILGQADAVVLSIEDVRSDETEIERLSKLTNVLVVTEGKDGARVYWQGKQRQITPPSVNEVNPTGAGDIFAAVFFIQYEKLQNPYEAASIAAKFASQSVTRIGMQSVPTPAEVKNFTMEKI